MGTTIEILDPAEFHHLKNVLRLKLHAPVTIFDGKGQEAFGIIAAIKKSSATVQLQKVKKSEETKPRLILACAIPKNAKFEFIIEKCTELGIDELIPMQTSRTIVRFSTQQKEKKFLRYQTVALNAAKQCVRSMIPRIHPVTSFTQVLRQRSPNGLGLIPILFGNRQLLLPALQQAISAPQIIFLIGPEGDFTKEEGAAAGAAGFSPVSLGPTTLKVDTAAISVVAAAHFVFDAHSP